MHAYYQPAAFTIPYEYGINLARARKEVQLVILKITPKLGVGFKDISRMCTQ